MIVGSFTPSLDLLSFFSFPSNHTHNPHAVRQFKFDTPYSYCMATNNKRKNKERCERKTREPALHMARLGRGFFFFLALRSRGKTLRLLVPHRTVRHGSCGVWAMSGRSGSTHALQRLIQTTSNLHLIAHWFQFEARVPFHRPAGFRSVGRAMALFPPAASLAVGAVDLTHCPPRDE